MSPLPLAPLLLLAALGAVLAGEAGEAVPGRPEAGGEAVERGAGGEAVPGRPGAGGEAVLGRPGAGGEAVERGAGGEAVEEAGGEAVERGAGGEAVEEAGGEAVEEAGGEAVEPGLRLEETRSPEHQHQHQRGLNSQHFHTRYWGDEGYTFPSPPPVDPFAKVRIDDCGRTKGCFRYGKPGCDAETCDYFLSYRRIGSDVEFELSADTDGWVAVGYSSDKMMGGDDVMACVHDDNGRVRIQHFYNVGQWAKEIKRNPARDEEGIFENNRVTCRFKRPVYVPRDETIIDLHLSWYYLFAWGPAIQGSITRHDIDSPPVSSDVVSIYKYEDVFMPSATYQTFSSPFCLLLIVALTFYILMGTP